MLKGRIAGAPWEGAALSRGGRSLKKISLTNLKGDLGSRSNDGFTNTCRNYMVVFRAGNDPPPQANLAESRGEQNIQLYESRSLAVLNWPDSDRMLSPMPRMISRDISPLFPCRDMEKTLASIARMNIRAPPGYFKTSMSRFDHGITNPSVYCFQT